MTEETLSVSGILLGKTFSAQDRSVERFRDLNKELARLQIRQAMVGRWFFMIIGTIFSIMPAFVYWLAGTMAANGSPSAPTAGDIVAFTTLQSRLFFPLGQLLNVQVEIQGSLALFDRIFEYLDLDPEITDAPDAVALEPATVRGSVALEGVSFHYAVEPGAPSDRRRRGGRGRPRGEPGARWRPSWSPPRRRRRAARGSRSSTAGAPTSRRRAFGLEDVSFEAKPGELVALVGPSGAGKTTTTYLIPRLYDVDDGRVTIDGIDVRQLKLESLGRVIGFVTQETYLFHASIRDNLLFAKPDATEEELIAAASAAAMHDRITEMPDGYDTVVGERGYKLSGGEKQRVAIARVLLKNPKILILDEATSSLDTVERAADPGGARPPDRGPHDDRDRPPPLDDPARRPDPRVRPRPDRGARHAPPADRARRPLRPPVRGAVRGRGGEPGRARVAPRVPAAAEPRAVGGAPDQERAPHAPWRTPSATCGTSRSPWRMVGANLRGAAPSHPSRRSLCRMASAIATRGARNWRVPGGSASRR